MVVKQGMYWWMNLILKRFLISLFLIGFVYTQEFEKWIFDTKKLLIDEGQITRLSFKAKIKIDGFNLFVQNNNFVIILNIPESIYQLGFGNDIIYYDNSKMDHYNLETNQFFRYKPDAIIVSFLDKITSNFLFDYSGYKAIDDNQYIYDKMPNKTDSLKIVSNNNSFDIYYNSNIYDCIFSEIDFKTLDRKEYNKLLLYSIVDTNDVEVFNFLE